MITTEELKSWKGSILNAKFQAEENALKNSENPAISKYYIHMAEVCCYQANIVDRIIADSEMHDKKGE